MRATSANPVQQPPPKLHVQNDKDSNHNVFISNLGNNNKTNIILPTPAEDKDELHALLDSYLSIDALHDYTYSAPTCHSGTRATVLREIDNWIDDRVRENSPLLWLYAPAGVGKSVIAKTIATFRTDLVIAAFFFSTSSTKDATTLFPTLAWQLGRRIPDTKKHIITSLKESGSLLTTELEKQFDLLIRKPLKSITPWKPRPIVIIDGADECTDERMLVKFLQVLVRAGEGGDMPVRFIICSRPERRIRSIMEKPSLDNPTTNVLEPQLPPASLLDTFLDLVSSLFQVFRSKPSPYLRTGMQRRGLNNFLKDVLEVYRPVELGTDEDNSSSLNTTGKLTDTLDIIRPHSVTSTIEIGFSEESIRDITKYLQDKFDEIREPRDGTESSDILRLAEASCGQFLYASIIARLLEELNLDPRDISQMARGGSLPTGDLNKLYRVILERAQAYLRNRAEECGPDFRKEQSLLMDSLAILVFFAGHAHFFTVPNNFLVIQSLLGLEKNGLSQKLDKMHSVLCIKPGISVQVYHRSFLEFLQSRKRSEEYCISYSTSLRRVLILMGRAGFRYIFKNDDFGRRCIQGMTTVFHRQFFQRSSFAAALPHLHFFIHFLVIAVLAYLSNQYTPVAPSVLIACWLCTVYFLCSFITFILWLLTYSVFFDYFIIIPFFHPFLHPFFVMMGGFLAPSRLLLFLVCIILTLSLSLLL